MLRSCVWIGLAVVSTFGSLGRVSAQPANATPLTAAPAEPLFSRHVVPLFSRLGCNAGGCHGAVKGQNGFRLSLFGADPVLDHSRLLREYGGRRLNLADPEQSLLLLKATGRLSHGGGQLTWVGSFEYRILREWIAQGARLDSVDKSRVSQLKVEPATQTLEPGETGRLRVTAAFADGSTEDVTALCRFETLDKDVATINADGRVHARKAGDLSLVIRFGAQPVMAMVVVPAQGKGPFPQVKEHNFIDKHVLDKLRRLNIQPSELCDDATFLRRASLDVTGALPPPEEVRAFLADKDPAKRAKKIDELLSRPGHAALWATRFMDILRPAFREGYNAPEADKRRMYEWLRARLAENTPYDQLVERILLASSLEGRDTATWTEEVKVLAREDATEKPELTAYNQRRTLDLYWQGNAIGVDGAIRFAHAFLGVRLACARCHRHPHDTWQQDDLLSFANFFSRVQTAGYRGGGEGEMKKAEAEAKKYADQARQVRDKKGKEPTARASKMKAECDKMQVQLAALEKDAKGKEVEVEKVRAQFKTLKEQYDQVQAEADKIDEEARALEIQGKEIAYTAKRLRHTDILTRTKGGGASVTSPLGSQKSDMFRLLGDGKPLAVPAESGQDVREHVVAWLRRPDNPFFARAIVNRAWAHYFGRGIVDPPDQLSALNPPSHPELLDELCAGFIQNKYDLQWLHRTILNSRTYQQSSRTNESNRNDKRNYACYPLRRLPAEVLVDAINHATGGNETYPPNLLLPQGAKAIELAGSTRNNQYGKPDATLHYALEIFGRPERKPDVLCDCERSEEPQTLQALYLYNHRRIQEKVADPNGRVARIVQQHTENARRIDEVFLWALSRLPTDRERTSCLDYVKESPTAPKGLEDVMWSLLNIPEFLLNH